MVWGSAGQRCRGWRGTGGGCVAWEGTEGGCSVAWGGTRGWCGVEWRGPGTGCKARRGEGCKAWVGSAVHCRATCPHPCPWGVCLAACQYLPRRGHHSLPGSSRAGVMEALRASACGLGQPQAPGGCVWMYDPGTWPDGRCCPRRALTRSAAAQRCLAEAEAAGCGLEFQMC